MWLPYGAEVGNLALQQLGVPVPQLPPYDPAKDEPFP